MKVNIVKRSSWRIPRRFIERWLRALERELARTTEHKVGGLEVVVAVIDRREMQNLNETYRHKNRPTDILSFAGMDETHLGDLVLCGEVLDRQAKDHGLTSRQELGYLLIHGVLHLLGYDHEQGGAAEKKMFALQQRLFDKLWPKFFKDEQP